jgi:hypothetical protein
MFRSHAVNTGGMTADDMLASPGASFESSQSGISTRAAAEPVDPTKLLERMRMLRMRMEARTWGRRVAGLM